MYDHQLPTVLACRQPLIKSRDQTRLEIAANAGHHHLTKRLRHTSNCGGRSIGGRSVSQSKIQIFMSHLIGPVADPTGQG